jgi:hypothetical protein
MREDCLLFGCMYILDLLKFLASVSCLLGTRLQKEVGFRYSNLQHSVDEPRERNCITATRGTDMRRDSIPSGGTIVSNGIAAGGNSGCHPRPWVCDPGSSGREGCSRYRKRWKWMRWLASVTARGLWWGQRELIHTPYSQTTR